MPEDFESLLSTMRSREISASIILQNIAQIKALYKDSWESLMGNCDSLLFLGGNEYGTFKYISELLGRRTVDTTTYARSIGRQGQYTTNYQATGRELITIDEMRQINKKNAVLLMRGERPVIDRKFDIKKHKNTRYTPEGGGLPYIHGRKEDEESLREKEMNDDNAPKPQETEKSNATAGDKRKEAQPRSVSEDPPNAQKSASDEHPIPPRDIVIDLGRVEDYEFYDFEEYLMENEEKGGN